MIYAGVGKGHDIQFLTGIFLQDRLSVSVFIFLPSENVEASVSGSGEKELQRLPVNSFYILPICLESGLCHVPGIFLVLEELLRIINDLVVMLFENITEQS